MLNFLVDDARCTRCGICVKDCPSRIIVMNDGAVPTVPPANEVGCIHCQHCLAVCPTAAVSIFGRNPDDSLPLTPDVLPTYAQMTRLARGRRSVRQYRDENVDPALLAELLATLANVPTGVNKAALTFTVVDDKAVMQRLRETTMGIIREAYESRRIPERVAYLKHVVEGYFRDGQDPLFRTAPHVLIVSAGPQASCPTEDVGLALATFDYLAQSAGLGTVWWGMLKSLVMALPELGPFFHIPSEGAWYAMLFGVPSVHYPRTVQRDTAAVVKTIR